MKPLLVLLFLVLGACMHDRKPIDPQAPSSLSIVVGSSIDQDAIDANGDVVPTKIHFFAIPDQALHADANWLHAKIYAETGKARTFVGSYACNIGKAQVGERRDISGNSCNSLPTPIKADPSWKLTADITVELQSVTKTSVVTVDVQRYPRK